MKTLLVVGTAIMALGISTALAQPWFKTHALEMGEPGQFTVYREAPGSASDPVDWVSNICDGVQRDRAVIWGTTPSLVGYANFDVASGQNCTAYLTRTPWKIKRNDPSITYTP